MFCFVILVPFKKQTLLKWRTTPPERDTRLPVNESIVASMVLNETELCEDDKPIIPLDSSKPNEIHEELSNDSKTETLSDFTIPDQEIDSTTTSQEDAVEDKEHVPKLTCESDATCDVTEKSLLNNNIDSSQTDMVTANLSLPGSPEPLVVDDSSTSHEHTSASHDVALHDPSGSYDAVSISGSHDPAGTSATHDFANTSASHDAASKVSGEKGHTDQSFDVKSNSGTDTPQQGKRKKVAV